MDVDLREVPDPWPDRDASPDEVNIIVQQELSNLKALKRLSIGSVGAPQDPDLPDLDFDADLPDFMTSVGTGDVGVELAARFASAPGSPVASSSGAANPHGSNSASSTPRFARQASITKQRSIRRERSLPITRKEQRKSPGFAVHPSSDAGGDAGGEGAASAAAENGDADIGNIWVPAALHPELAPNEWRTFVEEKLAEIRNSQEAQRESRKPRRHMSRLSHVVVAPEEYVDASAILAERRKSANKDDRRKSILELSKDFVDDDEPLARAKSVFAPEPDPRDETALVAPLAGSRLGGATSLRRSTHRMRRPTPRQTETIIEEPRSPDTLPLSASPVSDSEGAASSAGPAIGRRSSLTGSGLRRPSTPVGERTTASASHIPGTPSAATPTQETAATPAPGTPAPDTPTSHAQVPGTPMSQAGASSAPGEVPPSESDGHFRGPVGHLRNKSRQRNGTQFGPPPSDEEGASRLWNRRTGGRPSLSVSVAAAKAVAHTAEQPPSPSAATPSPTASGMLGYRRRKLGAEKSRHDGGGKPGLNMDTPTNVNAAIPGSVGSPLGSTTPITRASVQGRVSVSSALEHPQHDVAEVPARDPSRPPLHEYATYRHSSAASSTMAPHSAGSSSSSSADSESEPDTAHDHSFDSRLGAPVQEHQQGQHHQSQHQAHVPHANHQKRPSSHANLVGSQATDRHGQPHAGGSGMADDAGLTSHKHEVASAGKPADPPSTPPHSSSRHGHEHKESKDHRDKGDWRWRWLDPKSDSKQDHAADSTKSEPSTSPSSSPAKDAKKSIANLFKKRDSKKDTQQRAAKDSTARDTKQGRVAKESRPESKKEHTEKRRRGHVRSDSRVSNDAGLSQNNREAPRKAEKAGHGAMDGHQGQAMQSQAAPQVHPRGEETPQIQLPYDIPAHQISDRSYVMMHHRFPLHIERAIYRLSHMKLANPRRPLRQQVLLSNFMYAYLNLINYGYQQQQLARIEGQQQPPGALASSGGGQGEFGPLEASQIEQLRQIETKNYDAGMYTTHGENDESSSSSDDEDEGVAATEAQTIY